MRLAFGRCLTLLFAIHLTSAVAIGQESDAAPQAEADVAAELRAGHSSHGEAFNEGPRQQAYLMDGIGRVRFPVTIKDPLGQRFITQGVAQLHGFWYFEAERSFRQAAAIDPECAMAYWGMALANRGNEKRAKGFIENAVKFQSKASRREQLYITALDEYLKADVNKKKERAEKYTKALEKLLYEFPDDVEAKALLALQLWDNRSHSLPISSYLAVDALIQQVLDVEPLHPVHHYRIHLWDNERAELAVHSAANCGQALPAIAHMWHMSGHIYSRLKRYEDAVWQQEASARVDHAHMMRDGILPDQIHNFAHNNEWLIRNLNYVGRLQDAIDLAKNMIELPQHPKYNTLAKRGSFHYGRQRLFETLSHYERWSDMIAFCHSPYLAPTDDASEQVKRLRYLGQAYLRLGDRESGAIQLAELQRRLDEQKRSSELAASEAKAKAIAAALDQKLIDQAIAAAEQKAQDAGVEPTVITLARDEAARATREAQIKAKKPEIEVAINAARQQAEAAAYDQAQIDAAVATAEQQARDNGADPPTIAQAKATAELDVRDKQLKAKQPEIEQAVAQARTKAEEAAVDRPAIDAAMAQAEAKARVDAITQAKEAAEKSTREAQIQAKQKDIDKAEADAKKPFDAKVRELEPAIKELEGLQAVLDNDFKRAFSLLKEARGVDTMYVKLMQFLAGEQDEAIKEARKHVDSRKQEVQPLAMLIDLLWRAEKKDDARQTFEQLRDLSSMLELDSPVFARLEPIAQELGYPTDWRRVQPPREDTGVRPSLDSLGPFRWQPSSAPAWALKDAQENLHALQDYRGRAVVAIFYLGSGCLHCAEQLHAFAPKIEDFRQAGVDIVAISTDDLSGLKTSIANYDKGDLPITLLANPELDAFRAYHVYDDFEKQPLHATFLIDGTGLIRWQDISFEPFMDVEFLLKESQRLLHVESTSPTASLSAIDSEK